MENSTKHNALSDDELVRSYRSSGDNQWLGYLLQRYTLLLLGVAMKYLKDKDTAQDAVQQVFLKALTHFPTGEIHNFKGWLYILMRNHCLQILRDVQYVSNTDDLKLPAIEMDVSTTSWDAIDTQQINESLQELHEEQRKTIVLFYVKKMSYQQIMEQTGYTFMQVKSYLQNGKRNLKTILIKKSAERK